MAEESVLDRFIGIITEHLQLSDDVISDDSKFSDLGADSMDEVELVMSVEEEFDIEISDENAESVKTFSEGLALIERLIKES